MDVRISTVLDKLGQLTRADRRWVIERLPDQIKAQLLGASDEMSGEFVTRQASLPIGGQTLSQLSTVKAGQLFSNEPAWLVDALLRNTGSEWNQSVRAQLPGTQRAALAGLQSSVRLSAPVLESLYRSVQCRLQEQGDATITTTERSQEKYMAVIRRLFARWRQ